MNETDGDISFGVNQSITNDDLNALFASAWSASWPQSYWRDFQPMLDHSLVHVCAYHASLLVGFVNLVWDGDCHAYVSEAVVHPDFQRRGIGTRLVHQAIELARQNGVTWVHVDYEPHLQGFYQGCGFRPSCAGVIRLK